MLKPEITPQGMTETVMADSLYFSSHGLRPLSSGVTNGAPVAVDRFGFRKTSMMADTKKASWLLIGDSVTFGIGVTSDSTFAGIIQNQLDTINVLNPSASGYNIHHYLDVFRYFVTNRTHNLDIRRVIVGWCLNDVYTEKPDFRVPGERLRHLFPNLLSSIRSNSRLYFFAKKYLFDRPKSYYLFDSQFYNSEYPYFLAAIESLSEIENACRKLKIDFSVVLLPYEYQLRTGILSPQKLMAKALKERDIKVLNPFLQNQLYDSEKFFLYGDGIHLSNAGHRYVARSLIQSFTN